MEVERGDNPPDFVLSHNNKKFSIELTGLFKSTKLKCLEQQLEGAEKKIVNGVLRRIEKCNFSPIEVKIYFCDLHYPQKGYDIACVIVDLSDSIIEKMRSVSIDFKKISIPRDEIRIDGVFRVEIRNGILDGMKWLTQNRVWPNKSIWVRRDPFKEMQERISEKEKDLSKYRNQYERCYLLLIANRYQGSQAFECTKTLKKSIFDTDFDRVFFFDYSTHVAFELAHR